MPSKSSVKVVMTAGLVLAMTASGSIMRPALARADTNDYATDAYLNYLAARASEAIVTSADQIPGYAGIYIDSKGVNVASTSTTNAVASATRDALQSLHLVPADVALAPSIKTVPITYIPVKYDLNKLQAVKASIDAAAPELIADGVPLATWGVDNRTDRVVITLRSLSGSASSDLERKFGATVVVSDQTADPQASGNRTTDNAPWWGGDTISMGNGENCSSGFKMVSGGKDYFATAGHCGGSDSISQGGSHFGTNVASHFGGAMDGEIVHVSSGADDIWSDPTSRSRDIFAGSTADVSGHLLCTDGYTDREVCSVNLDNDHQSVYYSDRKVQLTNVVTAHQTSEKSSFAHGDSGGPVIEAKSSDQARAVGIVSGTAGIKNDSVGYYQAIRYVESYFGYKLDCGATTC